MFYFNHIISIIVYFQSADQVASSDGKCVWYGVCDRDLNKNCFYDGPPKVLGSKDAERLKSWCPHMVAADGDILTCCDSEQVRGF
jgi:hypothetical protein